MNIIFDLHGVIFDYNPLQPGYNIYTLKAGLEILVACYNQKDANGKRLHQLYILSNWGIKGFEKIKKEYDSILELFDGYVISGECGYSKPDKAIFEVLINRYQLHNQACLFIDDSAMNINAVKQFGWHAIHYDEPTKVTEKLKQLKII